MSKRSLSLPVAVALYAGLALAVPSEAGSITTVSAINRSGSPADDFEATFLGTGGTVGDVTVLFSSGIATTSSVISSGTGVEINFGTPLPNMTGALTFSFTTAGAPVTLDTAAWIFKSGPPIAAAPGTVAISSGPLSAVPEPASAVPLGIGMAALFICRQFARRKAIARP